MKFHIFLAVAMLPITSSIWGQSTFTKITKGAIVNDGGGSEGMSWVDYDNDGDLESISF
ncbi:MAG: hypothetical protein ACE5G1_04760 [bacterium]